ncbi:MAG: hypothetical protein KC503_07205 [Myxococcales bacterium]|nr:hypothetical protein [Myxococcales bacterium]
MSAALAMDGLFALAWIAAAGLAVAASVAFYRRGVPATYLRDALHVGAAAWVVGWPLWHTAWVPVLLGFGVAALFVAAPRLHGARRVLAALCGRGERWSGIALYAVAYAIFTAAGLLGSHRFAAGAALLSLSLGDGLGGFVGRRFGRLHYRAPNAKQKSVEGSLTVALASALALVAAAALFGAPITLRLVASGALVAALAEGLAPRSADNFVVPAAQWMWLRILGT